MLGCYQFGGDTHCFKSLKSDFWWELCAETFKWDPCYNNDYPETPEINCDSPELTTFASAESTEQQFLQNLTLCEDLMIDLIYQCCNTFCIEPYEHCDSGEPGKIYYENLKTKIKRLLSIF